MDSSHPVVFVSYSHDSEAHRQSVRSLSDRLRQDGIDCRLDQYIDSPPEGWPSWMDQQLEDADFVLVVASTGYREKARARRGRKQGRGVRFESILFVQDLYDSGMWNEKFIPVLLDGASEAEVPRPLRPYTYYRADTPKGYDALYRRLTEQPRIVPPDIGKQRTLPPESGPVEKDKPDHSERSGESTEDQKSMPSWGKRLAGPSLVLAILVAVLTIAGGVLDLSAKWRSFRENVEPTLEHGPESTEEVSIRTFSLRILDKDSGEPVKDVDVQIPERRVSTKTDEMGVAELELEVPLGKMLRVRASKLGYLGLERETAVGEGQDTWQMSREPRLGELKDQEAGSSVPSSAHPAAPEPGRTNLDQGTSSKKSPPTVIRASGIGASPSSITNPTLRRRAATKAAENDAKRNLAAWLEGETIEAVSIVSQGQLSKDEVRTTVSAHLSRVRTVDTIYNQDGTAEVTLELELDEK
jgi:hypothetical protein